MDHLSESQRVAALYYCNAKKGQKQHFKVSNSRNSLSESNCEVEIWQLEEWESARVLTSEDGSQPWRPWRAARSSDPESARRAFPVRSKFRKNTQTQHKGSDGYLVKLLGKSLDDHVAICDLLAVELNEGQHSLLGAVLALVIHILQENTNITKHYSLL